MGTEPKIEESRRELTSSVGLTEVWLVFWFLIWPLPATAHGKKEAQSVRPLLPCFEARPTTPRPSSQGDLSCLLAQVPRSTPVSQPAPPWPAHAFTMLPATSQDACAREADLPSARGQAAWESRGPGNRRRVTFTHLRLSLDPFHFPQFPPPLPQTSTYPFCFFGSSSIWTND